MKLKLIATVCAAALLPHLASAADDGTDHSVTVLNELAQAVVQRDGSHVWTAELLVQINEQRAVDGEAQRQFYFNRTMEDVEILEAYNEKPDGRRIPVLPEQIKLQQEAAYNGAPMFQDMQVKTLIYSDVAVGDKIYSKIRKKRHTALFENQFSDTTYPRFVPTRHMTLIYDLPSEMPLRVDNVGFQATAPQIHDGRTVYRWDYLPAENPRLEAGTVAYADFGRHLTVSTFNSYAEVGLAFDRAAAAAAAPTERITAKAREVVQGVDDPRAQALAIDNWVRRNIRYVGVYIGNGGLVPHSAESVLDNRYGDCKDHAALMEAMLRAVGIESTPVLINAGNSFKLSPVASLGEFNHAITYIPSLDLYLDSTAVASGPGYLPEWDLDKPVILTRSGQLGHTPTTQQGNIKIQYTVQIAADGSANFVFTRDNRGWIGEEMRYYQRNWAKNDRDRFVADTLKGHNIKGSGEVELGELEQGTGASYSYSLRGRGENWVYLPGTIGVLASSSLYAGLRQQVLWMDTEATRSQPYICPVNDFEEEAVYEFPEHAALLAVPPDVNIAGPFIQYRARFRQVGGKLLVERRLKSGKQGSRVCTPEDYLAMQPDIRRMVRDLRSQFILQVPEPAGSAAMP
jgi:transglutaminase-like putative cysteine protease